MIDNNQDFSNYRDELKEIENTKFTYNKKSDDGLQWLRDLDAGNLDSKELNVNEVIQN